MTSSVKRLWLAARRLRAAAAALCVCAKEHRKGEAAKAHKAITLAQAGDGVHGRCGVAGDSAFIWCLHSKNSYATQMQSSDDSEWGNGKGTLGELTLVGAQ